MNVAVARMTSSTKPASSIVMAETSGRSNSRAKERGPTDAIGKLSENNADFCVFVVSSLVCSLSRVGVCACVCVCVLSRKHGGLSDTGVWCDLSFAGGRNSQPQTYSAEKVPPKW